MSCTSSLNVSLKNYFYKWLLSLINGLSCQLEISYPFIFYVSYRWWRSWLHLVPSFLGWTFSQDLSPALNLKQPFLHRPFITHHVFKRLYGILFDGWPPGYSGISFDWFYRRTTTLSDRLMRALTTVLKKILRWETWRLFCPTFRQEFPRSF